jgi:hypothetical protein
MAVAQRSLQEGNWMDIERWKTMESEGYKPDDGEQNITKAIK